MWSTCNLTNTEQLKIHQRDDVLPSPQTNPPWPFVCTAKTTSKTREMNWHSWHQKAIWVQGQMTHNQGPEYSLPWLNDAIRMRTTLLHCHEYTVHTQSNGRLVHKRMPVIYRKHCAPALFKWNPKPIWREVFYFTVDFLDPQKKAWNLAENEKKKDEKRQHFGA